MKTRLVFKFEVPAVILVGAVLFGIWARFSQSRTQTTHSHDRYPEWRTSRYVLPYPPGKSYRVLQGNFYGGHLTLEGGACRYAYDFEMPIGSTTVAARGGRVVYTRRLFKNGNGGGPVGTDNVVLIDHGDGSYALYGHLTFHGSLVAVGEVVKQAQPIAPSGNTGMTGGPPHLSFMVSRCPGGRYPVEAI
jgi:murein DD-endopeptidase MepM/ murein hydrolase activator NlpD